MGEEANCDAVMEAGNGNGKAKENGHATAVLAMPDVKADDAVVAPADPRLQGISDAIRVVPHFPKQGIMFNDITTLLLRPGVFKDAVDMFVERYRGMGIAAVAGEVISETYVLEYGTDCLEMHVGAIEPRERVLIVDDLVATGGTLCAAINLMERAGADVVECACLIGLPKFKDFYKLNGKPVYVLVESLEYEK
ncbi:adenine phosphoribosyltransferase 2 isoform X2 [Triticum aestivum]|uniref:adenine phosphoribosyltransferase 2 isoform X2 n=1 Tax=Triticum aestivum TaxID=4565 RepID=UPI001D02516F|nr:adenine phosphoribosyltransferase 2-like isoform X2 [Triticum aestivum]